MPPQTFKVEYAAEDSIQLGKRQQLIQVDLEKMFIETKTGILKDWSLTDEFRRLKNEVQAALEKKKLDVVSITFLVSCSAMVIEEKRE